MIGMIAVSNTFKNSLTQTKLLLLIGCGLINSCAPGDDDAISIVVDVRGQSMSKLAFIIAEDQGLYEKHGLDVELKISNIEFEDGRIPTAPFFTRVQRRLGLIDFPTIDIHVTGHTPTIYNQTNIATWPDQIALASTDCSVRYYVVVNPGIEKIEDIKGKRIGINRAGTTSGFAAMQMIERMGWDSQFDVSVLEDGRGVENLKRGEVDVAVGGDEAFEAAQTEGYKILADTRSWNESLAGNSVLVETGWLDQGTNREAARRFLRATLEGLSIFHLQPELAIDIAARWYGHTEAIARGRYERADYVPRIPYPCYEGIANVMRIYDSHEMRRHSETDFFDDSVLEQIVKSGFVEELYKGSESEISPDNIQLTQ